MKKQKTTTAPEKVLKRVIPRRHAVACVFQTQCTFRGYEVRKSPLGVDKTVMPRKKALAELETEYTDYLKQNYRVDRLQVDARTLALLGVAKLDGSWDSIAPDSGHRDTRIPQSKSHYTYLMCFHFLLEHDFAEEDCGLDDGDTCKLDSPSKEALEELGEELTECLREYYVIDCLGMIPSGGLYVAMLELGLV